MPANRIKGITVEVGGDTAKLQTAIPFPDYIQVTAQVSRYLTNAC